MDSLIQVVNKLQDVFNTLDTQVIQLPQIAVVGTQSAGKSSVIESIVGRTFLPRGTGIVTRRPLVLQLIRCPLDDYKYRLKEKGTLKLEEWGEFLHKEGEVFADFDGICKEIELDTDRVAGDNKGICNEPINLKIYSHRVVDLTLVDLPGLTKVPVGDQPKDIEDQIKTLMLKYIENPNCIILAVTTANMDIATSEALKFAKEVDPDGSRTLAVLTKLDLMDQGTDANDVLNGEVLPVKLGIIGVINRSQKDINENKSINEQLVKEAEFFKRNYSACAERNGTPYLAETLSKLLMHHIRDRLPDLKKRINAKISYYQLLLKSYGDKVIDKNNTLYRIITKFARAFQTTMDGTTRSSKGAANTHIFSIIHEEFDKMLNQIQPHVNETEAKAYLLENSLGPRPHLFDVPSFDGPFERIVKEHIKKLKEPSLELIDIVRKELQRNIQYCGPELTSEWKRFPKLKQKMFEAMNKLVCSRIQAARHNVENLVDIQTAYINKKHPDFNRAEAIAPLVKYKQSYGAQLTTTVNVQNLAGSLLSCTESNKENYEVLSNLVKSYFLIVRKSIQDTVPKAIMYYLVNSVSADVESELITRVCEPDAAEVLLNEADNISVKRQEALAMLTALTRANQIINEMYEEDDNKMAIS